jgi:hypothetical protein
LFETLVDVCASIDNVVSKLNNDVQKVESVDLKAGTAKNNQNFKIQKVAWL